MSLPCSTHGSMEGIKVTHSTHSNMNAQVVPVQGNALTTPVSLSVLTVTKGKASKQLLPGAHGQPIKGHDSLGITAGVIEHVTIAGLTGLQTLLATIRQDQVLVHGVVKGSAPGHVAPLVTTEALKQAKPGTFAPGTVARSLEFIAYPDDVFLIMIDRDDNLEDPTKLPTAEALLEVLAPLIPGITDAGAVITSSTSSAIRDKATDLWLTPPTGFHVYLLVRGNLKRFVDLLTVRLWNAGYGYCKLATPNAQTGVAAVLTRAAVDLSVFSPERLDYVAGARIAKNAPFYQDRGAPLLRPGTILDLDAFPDITADERQAYTDRLNAAKAVLAPERFACVKAVVQAQVPDLTEAEVCAQVEQRLAHVESAQLPPDYLLYFFHRKTAVAVQDLTAAYDGLRLADPAEPTYRDGTDAILHWRHGDWLINSFAHGLLKTYRAVPTPPPETDDGDMEDLLQLAPTTRKTSRAQPTQTGLPTLPTSDPAANLGTVSPCTHTANARRLVRLYTPTLRYVLGEGWILWTGQFWRPDPTSTHALTTGFVSGLARSIAEEAAALFTAASQQTSESERKELYALAKARGDWAVQSENANVITGGLKLAQHDLLLMHDEINTNPWLFNCRNTTIDLRTGQPQAHNPADFITHLAPVTYDEAATCPTWEAFLQEVFASDTAMVAFIQRGLGSSLTSIVQDRALFFLYGEQGHNGKTTLVEAFRDLLGASGEESFGYARKVDVMTFMKSKNYEDNLRKAAQLTGARFVYSSEIDEEHRLNEQLIKDMTGGDTMEARRLYREAFTFKPTFKPWMYGNHKPEIRGTDDALWGRVKLIEFPVSFADRMNLQLPHQLRAELPGILNWAIKGCLDWQRSGLQPPEKVLAATKAYREEQDTIGQFIRERCQVGADYMRCKAAALYATYRQWAEDMGHVIHNQKRVWTYLTAHGYPSDDNVTGRGAFRKNIALIGQEDDPRGGTDDDDDHQSATLRQERVAATIASNDAVKDTLKAQNATLATLDSRKSSIAHTREVLPGNKGSKGSNHTVKSAYPIENTTDTSATLPLSKGSSPPQGSPCPTCGYTSWHQRLTYHECLHCGYKEGQTPQEILSSPPERS